MNAVETISNGLLARGMMPMDGACKCDGCGASGLTRAQVYKYSHYSTVCETCLPLWTHGERDQCECGRDKINHSGPTAFVECYFCANNPAPKLLSDIADNADPLPNNDAFYDLVEPYERKYGLGGIYDHRQHSDDAMRDHSIDGVGL